MSIDRNNYETYLIDYLDGKLGPVEVSEVLLFLEQNPDIRAEFEGLDALPADETTVSERSADFTSLRKPDFSQVKPRFENLLIGALEHDLSDEEKKELGEGLKVYPELVKEQQLFALTKLEADQHITIDKRSLRRSTLKINWYQTIVRVAAVLLLTGTIGWFINKNNEPVVLTSNDTRTITGTGTAPKTSTPVEATKQPAEKVIPASPASSLAKSQHSTNHTVPNTTPEIENVVAVQHETPEMIRNNTSISLPVNINSAAPSLAIARQLPRAQARPAVPAPAEEFDNLTTFAMKKMAGKKSNQNTGNNNNSDLVKVFNNITGADLRVEQDTTSGKMTRFEIASLGIGWERSK